MPGLLELPRAPLDGSVGKFEHRAVRRSHWSRLAGVYGAACASEMRKHERFAFPRLVHVFPADDNGSPLVGGMLVAAGRQMSEGGLGFFHSQPIAHREVIVSVEKSPQVWQSYLLELRWCKFIRPGRYESGGRLLKEVPTPDVPRN